jgi:hypothetical protein
MILAQATGAGRSLSLWTCVWRSGSLQVKSEGGMHAGAGQPHLIVDLCVWIWSLLPPNADATGHLITPFLQND